MNLVKHGFQAFLQRLVFGTLVEFTHEMTSDFQGFVAEIQG